MQRLLQLGSLICMVGIVADPRANANSLNPPVLRNDNSQFILLEPESIAPATTLRTLDGRALTIANFRGKVVLLNFWATWCAPCVEEMASLDALGAKFSAEQFVVVAVSLDRGSPEAVGSFVVQHQLRNITVLLDRDHQLGSLPGDRPQSRVLAINSLPVTYVLDREGRVTGFLSGPENWMSAQAQSFMSYFVRLNR